MKKLQEKLKKLLAIDISKIESVDMKRIASLNFGKKGFILVGLLMIVFCSMMSFKSNAVQENTRIPMLNTTFTNMVQQNNQPQNMRIKRSKVKAKSESQVNVNLKEQVTKTTVSINYNVKIPLSMDAQNYLTSLCVQRGLIYKDTLAVIEQESGFNANMISSTNDYGLMQINKQNHENLAETLKTSNTPLNVKTNLNWGTYMLSSLFKQYKAQGLYGTNLENAVLSSYNKGIGGYKKTGIAQWYVNNHANALIIINQWL